MRAEEIFSLKSVLGFPSYVYPDGAGERSIVSFESSVGYSFPQELRDMYSCHNGEVLRHDELSPGLFGGLPFISLDRSKHIMEVFRDGAAVEQDFPGLNHFLSEPKGCVQEAYYCSGWVPFAGFRASDHFAVDFSPAENGKVGQIILYGRDNNLRLCLANSFREFVDGLLLAYSKREFHPVFGWSIDRLCGRP